jgi:hypothetical protein
MSVYRPRDTLQAAGVPKIYVDNPEVGHGADHTEIAVMYEWLDRWNDPTTGGPPPGGTKSSIHLSLLSMYYCYGFT